MKNFLRSSRVLSPWLSLAWPFFLFVTLSSMKSLYPNLFCVAVNPGGQEFICGADYSHPGVRLFQVLGNSVWMLILIKGGVDVLRGRATRGGIIAWSVSVLLLVSLLILWINLPVECSP